MVKINTDEWTAELERVQQKRNDAGMTSAEIADVWGVSRATAVERLGVLNRAGRLERGTRTIESLSGKNAPVPVYRVKGKGKK
jgi:predicted transcriptional regulator